MNKDETEKLIDKIINYSYRSAMCEEYGEAAEVVKANKVVYECREMEGNKF